MATLTNEQIEAKKQQKEADAIELPEEALDQAAGGMPFFETDPSSNKVKTQGVV